MKIIRAIGCVLNYVLLEPSKRLIGPCQPRTYNSPDRHLSHYHCRRNLKTMFAGSQIRADWINWALTLAWAELFLIVVEKVLEIFW